VQQNGTVSLGDQNYERVYLVLIWRVALVLVTWS